MLVAGTGFRYGGVDVLIDMRHPNIKEPWNAELGHGRQLPQKKPLGARVDFIKQ